MGRSMAWEDVAEPVAEHLRAVEGELKHELSLIGSPIEEELLRVVDAGGKRIRPLLVLLVANAGQPDWVIARCAACAVEMVHTASLLHDDVLDDASVRRGTPTLHVTRGAKAAVLGGDVLYCRALELCLERNLAEVAVALARAARLMAEAEVGQIVRDGELDWTTREYIQVIRQKTGGLFAAAAGVGAYVAGLARNGEAFRAFGLHLGTAFQIVDDVLDYLPRRSDWGKESLADLRQRRATLPLLLARERGVVDGWPPAPAASQLLHKCGALDEALQIARGETEQALEHLQTLEYASTRRALSQLCRLVTGQCT
jgi:octaprenyl-diphosphate synthase